MPELIAELETEVWDLADLKPDPENPRTHPKKGSPKWEALRKSLELDYFDPIGVNRRTGVGDGGKLSTQERQSFMALAAAGDEDLAKLCKTSLLRMWLFGKTLSQEQLDEIADELPLPNTKVTKERYQRAPTDYGHIAVSRRTFFRWTGYGKQCPTGADLPPFDDPGSLLSWYERMKAHGFFKNAFPKEIKNAIALHLGSAAAAKPATFTSGKAVPLDESGSNAPQTPSPRDLHQFDPGSALGLLVELDYCEKRTARLRMALDDAEKRNLPTAAQLAHEYNEAFDRLSIVKRRALDVAEREKYMVTTDDVRAVFGPPIKSIVVSGPFMFDRIDAQLMAEPDRRKRRGIFRRAWVEMCKALVSGKFAPPLQLETLFANDAA